MAASRSRWILGCGASIAVCLFLWASVGLTQGPTKSTLKPLIVAPEIPQTTPAQRLTPDTPLADDSEVTEANSFGCVVLGDGRVFQGEVIELAAAYQVRTKTASVVLPFEQVRTVAPTLTQAYLQLRDSYEQPTASDHLDLGRWCEQNKLNEEASAEAQSALALEPTRKEALSLLKKAETAIGRSATLETPPQAPVVPRPAVGIAMISAESQVEFNRRILPLALNKCGNGTCHGASALSPFKLQKNARPEQNLQVVLKYVDSQNPEMSPLLVRARTADVQHGRLFQGARGSEQYARLMAWVVQAAEDQNQLAGVRKRPQEPRSGGPRYTIRPRSRVPAEAATEEPSEPLESSEIEVDAVPEIETIAGEDPVPVPRQPRQAPLKSEAIQKLLEAQEPDAFDPEEFNRLVHGNAQP